MVAENEPLNPYEDITLIHLHYFLMNAICDSLLDI